MQRFLAFIFTLCSLLGAHADQTDWQPNQPVPLPLTDEQFQRLYQMAEQVSTLFESNEISYFIEGITLLGAVRHGGLIPWDPSLHFVVPLNDYALIMNLKETFATFGLDVVKSSRYQYRISIQDPSLDLSLELHFYWISKDLFGRKKVLLAEHRFQYMNPDYLFFEEVFPLKTKQFGKMHLRAPGNPEPYLTRRYGADWKHIARTERKYNGFSHTFQIQDFSPYPDRH